MIWSMFDLFSWLLTWGNVLGTLGNVVLGFVLAILYNQQKNLLKIERNPSIEVSDFDIDRNELDVYLSNYGHGLAKNIRLRTTVEFLNDPNTETQFAEFPLHRISDGDRLRERSIGGNQRTVHFRGRPPFPLPDENFGDFFSGVRALVERGISEFDFCIEVRYESQLDDTGEQTVVPVRHIRLSDEQVKNISRGKTDPDLKRVWSFGGVYVNDESA